MPVVVNDEARPHVSEEIMQKIEAVTTKALARHNLPAQAEISLTFCDNEQIRVLNKTWRQKDEPTDVLSFPLWQEEEINTPLPLLGDIIISLERAKEQAQEYGHSVEREILYLYTHGLLHLLGYDHINEQERQKMRRCEEELLQWVGAEREGV
ncbi:MAG: rRNA maturation RNase YbeY [Firmicutes bacterium]|nr:rRNA maturation RNase YbeY [Bacillota bacterium]